MRTVIYILLIICLFSSYDFLFPADWRNIETGIEIPSEGYADQPYIVKADNGNWVCVLTTGSGKEGDTGQHIVAIISPDQGNTWSDLISIEPAEGPEASWALPFKAPSGRIYVFYTYNSENIRKVPDAGSEHVSKRVDTLGDYVFRYSDDHGRTWSKERYTIPVREMAIDRSNNFQGDIRLFWGVGKPVVQNDAMYFGFTKVGKWGTPGAIVTSEGCFMRSENILTETDPEKLNWQTLPFGDHGLLAPKGPIAEETCLVPMNDGSLAATYRTIDGYLCMAYSRDLGRHWTDPEYATYSPGGKRIKQPRAYGPIYKFNNGRYLLWYHNHGGEKVHRKEWGYYRARNPAWISGGIEVDGHIYWAQPEILLYHPDREVRMSYPDFVEEDGRFWVTQTQKSIARIHPIDADLLEAVWNQHSADTLVTDGLIAAVSGDDISGMNFSVPKLPDLTTGGFSLDFWLNLEHLTGGQVILDTRDESNRGLLLSTTDRFTIELILSDGQHTSVWDSDPGTHPGTLRARRWQHVVITVDGQANIITFVVNGVLNDGGARRQYGWGRLHPGISDVNGRSNVQLAPAIHGKLRSFRIYNRYLLTSEAVSNYHAGK